MVQKLVIFTQSTSGLAETKHKWKPNVTRQQNVSGKPACISENWQYGIENIFNKGKLKKKDSTFVKVSV